MVDIYNNLYTYTVKQFILFLQFSILHKKLIKRLSFLSLFIISITVFSQNGNSSLVINEFLANSGFSNDSPDWVEVYNSGEDTINLVGMYWTNDLSNPRKTQISDSFGELNIHPKQYRYFVFSKKREANAITFNLNLNDKGGQIGLYSNTGLPIDTLSYGPQQLNVSCGRQTTENPEKFYSYFPSPGEANKQQEFKERVGTPIALLKDGYYDGPLEIELEPAQKGDRICYTLDGSFPNPNSCFEYMRPFHIEKTSILKAASFRNGHLASKTISRIYLLRSPHHFPVFSLSVDNWDSFYQNTNATETDEELVGHSIFIDTSGQKVFSKYVGISLAGGASRRHTQKPISIHTRSYLGGKWMKYPMFPDKQLDKFRSFVFRNDGNSVPHTHFKDALLQNIASELGTQDYLSSRPVVVYVNGNYYGIYNVREKKCKHYFENNHQVDGDSLDVLINYTLYEKMGKNDDFIELNTFVENNDLGIQENLNFVANQVDINNFLDYQILQIYYANTDWPINNVRLWRSKESGKWRWMLFDLDLSFREYKVEINSLEYALGKNNFHSERENIKIHKYTTLLRGLMDNTAMRNKFINRFADLLNTSFQSAHIVAKTDSLQAIYEPEIREHIDHWQNGEDSEIPNYNYWLTGIDNIKSFATQRSDFMWRFILDQWKLKGTTPLSIVTETEGAGKVQVNSIYTKGTKWEGNYFQDIPITITAVPMDGYKFTHWEMIGEAEGFSKKKNMLELIFNSSQAVELKAHFKKK